MNRLGFSIADCIEHFNSLTKYCDIMGIITHFSDADNIHNTKTKQQLAKFTDCKTKLAKTYPYSLANSAAILAWPETHGDWVRPGLMLYGVSPFENSLGSTFNLKPVMQLVAKIIAINLIHRGETIGYGSRFVCPEDMLVGVISIGYGDGYTSLIKDGTPVLVQQRRTKIIGRVSMDMATIDLRNCDHVQVGDEVTLWGDGLPVEEVARHIGIIPYELLTSIGSRVTRVYV
jgi:alanine racemase